MAAWYDRLVGDEGSDYHRQVILPTAMKLLEIRPGERILDLCCGQGVLTRLLAEEVDRASGSSQGKRDSSDLSVTARSSPPPPLAHSPPPSAHKTRIVGVDASPRLIAAAKARGTPDPRIKFIVRDATDLGELADGSFDAAACVMAVQDVQDTAALFRELGRALRPGGRAVIVMMHPCFRVPRQSDWGWDEAKKTQYRRVDRYMSPMQVPIATHPGSDPGQQTFFSHRPLRDYLNALGAAGLAVVAAEEPTSHREPPPGPRHRGQKRSFEEIPVFLAMKAIKLQ